MASKRKPTNPFYALLILAGTAFLVTALAYGVMMVRTSRPAAGAAQSNPAILKFMKQNGGTLLMIELAALGVFTVAAIGTDGYWDRRAQRKHKQTNL